MRRMRRSKSRTCPIAGHSKHASCTLASGAQNDSFLTVWPQIPARIPNRHVPGSASTVNGGSAKRNPARSANRWMRTTLTGADEPYNRRGDSRQGHLHSSGFPQRATVHNYHLSITFLLDLSASAKTPAFRFHRAQCSPWRPGTKHQNTRQAPGLSEKHLSGTRDAFTRFKDGPPPGKTGHWRPVAACPGFDSSALP